MKYKPKVLFIDIQFCVHIQGIKNLKEKVVEITLQQQYMGEKIPGVWLSFEDNMKR